MKIQKLIFITLCIALGACSSDNNDSNSLSSQVDIAKLHTSSKRLIGFNSDKDKQSATSTQSTNSQAKSRNMTSTSVMAQVKMISAEELTQVVDLDELYQKLSPEEYEPAMKEMAERLANKDKYKLGTRYLERLFFHNTTLDGSECLVEGIVENIVLKAQEKSFHVIEDVRVGQVYQGDNIELCSIDLEATRLTEYNKLPFSRHNQTDSANSMKHAQVYLASENTYIINDVKSIAVMALDENGNVHMDAVFTSEEGIPYGVAFIPQPTLSEEKLEQRFQGIEMQHYKETVCDSNFPGMEENGECISNLNNATIIFNLEDYL